MNMARYGGWCSQKGRNKMGNSVKNSGAKIKLPIFTRGDFNGVIYVFVGNIGSFLVGIAALKGFGWSDDLIFDRVIPGICLGLLFSGLYLSLIHIFYIQSGDYLINEMHGYRTAIDSGYLRESITPLTGSSSLDIRIYEAASSVTSLRYELRDVTNTRLIEEGTGTTLEKVQSEKKSRVSFNTGLVEGREYCLTLILSDDSDSEI